MQTKAATWGEDLFLMCHFTSSTARTISSRTEVLDLWQTVIPEEATTCPFLLHGILALSALHLASLRPSQRGKYEQCCRRHQYEVIPDYRRALRDIKPDSSGRVFAMAFLDVLLGLATISDNALYKEDMPSEKYPEFTDVMAMLTVVRGVRAILKQGTPIRHTIINGRYGVALTGHTAIDCQNFELPIDVQVRYQRLMTDCLDSLLAGNKSAQNECVEAISRLQSIHRELLFLVSKYDSEEGSELELVYLVKWLGLVSPKFVAMLRQKNTASLVILGDYFVLWRLLESRWFLKNVTTNALNAIRTVIDPRGLEWLQDREMQDVK